MGYGGSSVARTVRSPRFLACALILVAAGAGMQPAIGALIRHYSKEPIELRRSLRRFDPGPLPSFVHDPTLESYAVTEEIGTDEFLEMALRPRGQPRGPATALLVTYYSDPRDRIPHTPDVCYVQAGATIAESGGVPVPTPFLGPERSSIEARLLRVQSRGSDQILVYFFWCNGRSSIEREEVRWRIGFPGPRHIYFSKLEAVAPIEEQGGREAAVERCTSLLSEMLQLLVAEYFPRPEDL
jgi:hypothetical protein